MIGLGQTLCARRIAYRRDRIIRGTPDCYVVMSPLLVSEYIPVALIYRGAELCQQIDRGDLYRDESDCLVTVIVV